MSDKESDEITMAGLLSTASYKRIMKDKDRAGLLANEWRINNPYLNDWTD